MTEQVILVDEKDNVKGSCEKMKAHHSGLLHRAFSVFIFNSRGELLLQKRANGKYHSAGLWTNTCCGHPRPGEKTAEAALRRLKEEMGISCKLTEAFSFAYCEKVGHELTENEYDHVFFGKSDAEPVPDPGEVAAWKYAERGQLKKKLKARPENFTIWFNLLFNKVYTVESDSLLP